MTDSLIRYRTIRKLLGVNPTSTPATVSEISALPVDLFHSDDLWNAYCRQSMAKSAGFPGLYAALLWRALQDNIQCAPELDQDCTVIIAALVSYAAADDTLQLKAIAENRLAFDRCFFHLRIWYLGLGPTGRKFVERLKQLADKVNTGSGHWREALTAFNLACDKELDRAAMLAERMQASELGHIKIAYAHQRVNDIYNDFVALHKLPESSLDFIDNIVLPSLQHLLINESEQAPDWSFWIRMLRLIVWSANPDKPPEDRQTFFNKGPVLLSQLENEAVCKAFSEKFYQDYVDEFSAQIISLLKGHEIDAAIAPKRQVSDEVETLSQLQIGGGQHHFSTGDWLDFDDGEGHIRCQFLMQAPGTDTLLFVNRSGHKVLQKTIAQMSACFDAGIAQEIPKVPALSASLSAVNVHLEALQERYAKQAQAKRAERELLEHKKQLLEKAKKQQQLARQEATLKARAEAEHLAREKAAREQAIKAQKISQEHEAREQQMRDMLDSLTLGTWADLPLNNGNLVRCKLAVSMRSSSKYIFVDRVGTKVAELHYDDLLGFLLRDEATFYKPEQGFESRLETIVRGLRRTE